MNRRSILCIVACLIPTSCALSLLAPRSSLADIDAVRQLGLRPNDVSFDNGRIITDAIAAGRINDTLHFPGGIYYHSTPILIDRNSIAITGQGFARWTRAGALKDTAAAILFYIGPAEQPAWVISGDGCRLDGINIWRDFYPPKGGGRKAEGGAPESGGRKAEGVGPEEDSDPPPLALSPQQLRGSGTAIEFRDWGRHVFRQVGVSAFDVGFHFAPSNHVDCMTFEAISFNACRVSVLGREKQAIMHDWRGVFINGDGETVFDVAGGANWTIDSLMLNEPRLVVKGGSGSGTCSFSFTNFKVDNNAAGWRLWEMVKPGPLNLTMRGEIGQRATMGERPIVFRKPVRTRTWTPPADYQHLDVELRGPNPTGGAVWRPKVEDGFAAPQVRQ